MNRPIRFRLQMVSLLGLALSIVPAMLLFAGGITRETYLRLLVLGMLLWFGSAVIWIRPEHTPK